MDLEDVSDFKLSEELALQLLNEQRECTFAWSTRSGTPAAATMSYVHRDGALWLATVEGRKRLRAIRERPSVSVVISSVGTSMGPGKSLTFKADCQLLTDRTTKEWFFDVLATVTLGTGHPGHDGFVKMLDTPNRVVLRVPAQNVTNSYDGALLRAAMAGSSD